MMLNFSEKSLALHDAVLLVIEQTITRGQRLD